jgi:hypothetical protein
LLGTAVGALLLAAADQVMLHTVLADGVFLGAPIAPFAEPLFSDSQRALVANLEHALANDRQAFEDHTQFDPLLGWCPRPGERYGEASFDWAGSRMGPEPLPRSRADGERLIGLVGCSFTLGSEVQDDETWAYELDERWADTRFGNFGFGGYGVDQALLRWRRDVAPLEPEEIWLGFFPGAALRASSHFEPLYSRWFARIVFFKPRFTLDDSGRLVLQPSPAKTPDDVVRLLRDPGAFLAALGDDPWIARARPAYMPEGTHWTHHSGFARILLTLHERRERDVEPMLRDETSWIFRLNLALIRALASETEARGARFRMLVLPNKVELAELAASGTGHWMPLCDRLRAEGVEVLDLTGPLLAAGVDDGDAFWMPGGHCSPRTNALIADAIDAAWGKR